MAAILTLVLYAITFSIFLYKGGRALIEEYCGRRMLFFCMIAPGAWSAPLIFYHSPLRNMLPTTIWLVGAGFFLWHGEMNQDPLLKAWANCAACFSIAFAAVALSMLKG